MAASAQETLQTAIEFYKSGEIADAKRKYLDVLRLQPDNAIALHHLGVCCHKDGNNQQAINLIHQSLKIQPHNAAGHDHLGVVLSATGDIKNAEACFKNAIAVQPSYASAYCNLGKLLIDQDKYSQALDILQKAPEISEDKLKINKLLGRAFLKLGNYGQALLHLEKFLMIDSTDPEVLSDIAISFEKLNKNSDALKFHSLAICRLPGENHHWQLFCEHLKKITPALPLVSGIESRLEHLLASEISSPQDLVQTVIGAAEHDARVCDIFRRWTKPDESNVTVPIEDMVYLGTCRSFMTLMATTPIDNLSIENILTRSRKELLASRNLLSDEILPFASSLALQCFNNEYVYFVSEEEKQEITKLKYEISQQFNKDLLPNPTDIAILGSYIPLYDLNWPENVLKAQCPKEILSLLNIQIYDYFEETRIRASIGRLTNISAGVSLDVQNMYEENPYPRWIKTNIRRHNLSISEILTSSPISIDLENYQSPDSPDILVAGCGTGQHAIQPATRFKAARVTAIDLSLSSLSYAKRQTAQLGIDNISFLQADILELGEIDRQFDVIECVGVLHHLENPYTGFRTLTGLLKSGGLMKIGLYSEAARQDVIAGRQIVSANEFKPTADGIRACRQFIIDAAREGNNSLSQLCQRSDFHNLSACRDLIFHIQEHRFNLLQIGNYLEKLGLKFLDFEMNFTGQLANFRNSIKGLPAGERLMRWHEYEMELPDTFRGMYQFWCRKPKN
ncbi:hypothetical protein AUP42_06285 [Thalassospira lucentensis]|uniref:Methyltransferase domain-containing protein n=2 Tax=Thalassospira TaxID=168934 RepID=A0A154L172_9PROT|nr:methyltransferase domain-containing protein [Thalassospira lucentensis]KZB61563.1 hypothetical protein AUP42_06285 [Thalassospira lucentensis]